MANLYYSSDVVVTMSSDNALDPIGKKRAKFDDASCFLSDSENTSFDDLVNLNNDSLLGYLDDTIGESSGSDDNARNKILLKERCMDDLNEMVSTNERKVSELEKLVATKGRDGESSGSDDNARNKILLKERCMDDLNEMVSTNERKVSELEKLVATKGRDLTFAREDVLRLSGEKMRLKYVISSKDAIISLRDDKLPKEIR